MPTTSIDDILTNPDGHTASSPDLPEEKENQTPESDVEAEAVGDYDERVEEDSSDLSEDTSTEEAAQESTVDEYGNESTKKHYTQEEVNAMIRERLARAERNAQSSPPAQNPTQEKAFTSNPEETWEQQLDRFVENKLENYAKQKYESQRQFEQQQQDRIFAEKLIASASRFPDYDQVVGVQPITEEMVKATYEFNDAGAFFYAAAKRTPKELERISKIKNPLSQAAEIGKLEERLRKMKEPSRAPKPISRTSGDRTIPHASDKKQSIEDLMHAEDEAKKVRWDKTKRR